MKKIISLFALVSLLLGCEKKDVFRVGVTNGPHAQIAEYVVAQCKKNNFPVEITYFDDFIQPNAALAVGEIDMNIYQHLPFLEDQVKSRGYALASVGKAILLPLGIYGGKGVTSLESVRGGGKVLIPSDPTNGSRALHLLEKTGVMTFKDPAHPTPMTIAKNPKNLHLVEIDAPLLPRLLQEDAALAVINADWIIVAGMDPKAAFFTENPKDSPYVNIIVVREKDVNEPKVKAFVEAYQSASTKKFIEDTFHGAVLAGW